MTGTVLTARMRTGDFGELCVAGFQANGICTGYTATRPTTGVENTNASIFKNFPIWEQVALQFRLEAFNAFNHPNLGNPNTNIQSASFGYITAANTSFGARTLQLAGKVTSNPCRLSS